MNSQINLGAVLVASLLGIMLSATMLTVSGWRRMNKTSENNYIRYLVIAILVTNIVNPIPFYVDGHTSLLAMVSIRVADFVSYFSNVVVGYLWSVIVATHINMKITKVNRIIINTICICSTILLFVNMVYPIVYYFDENNIYHRGPLSIYYSVIEMVFAIYGIVLYVMAKKNGGVLKFFPVWQFVLPVVIGVVIQRLNYGITMIIPCGAISVLGLLLGLKNTRLFGDPLTNTYNRFYLNYIQKKLESRKNGEFIIMMLDMNDFKSINDNFGHAEGDIALVQTARILVEAVGTLGSVIRYAGDEFVILLNTKDEIIADHIVRKIKNAMKEYNEQSGKGYEISISIGSSLIDLKSQTVDEIMNIVDRKMYEDKKVFYKEYRRREYEQ